MKEKLQQIDKKIWIIGGSFLILFIIIIFGSAFIYNKFFQKHSYEEIETIMLEATKSYLNENSSKLPQNINDSISIPVSSLIKAEKMNSIESYLNDNSISCDGEIKVTKINENYRYSTFLDCGEDNYKTIKFIDYIKENIPTVTSDSGLYTLNNELVYRGENVNNYISLSGKTYRIIKFTQENPVIIYTEKLENSNVWDDRYNIEKEDNTGINDYKISRIKEYLDNLYNGNDFLTENDKLLITAHNIGIGKRNSKDTDKTGSLENSTILENQYIGLIQMNDYLNASTDNNCTNTTSPSCANYNYLSKYKFNWWTLTASNSNSYRVFRIEASSHASLATTDNNNYIRPVLYLSKDTIYVSGDGTKENPFIVK